jgi:AraC-like DNA-binding protein
MLARCREVAITPQTKALALMRVAGLNPFVAFVGRAGAPVERLLERACLPPRLLDHPERLIPVAQVLHFMDDAATDRGLADLGLRAGRGTTPDALGMLGRLVRRARTLGEAVETLIRSAPAFDSGGRFWLERQRDRARLCHKFGEGLGEPSQQADQYWLMVSLNVLWFGLGPRWRPDEVRFETYPAQAVGRADIFSGARVAFGQTETAIGFPAALLARPLPPPRVTEPLDRRDVDRWFSAGPADDFVESVLQVVVTLASPEYPRIDTVARAIGIGVRTLQRRLAEAGASYERVLTRARFGTAAHLLETTDATVLDIALDVGYSDHAHFTRAFRRWTGVPPREFRKNGRRHIGDAPRLQLTAWARAL